MTDFVEQDSAPVAHVTISYQGPIAPHWDMKVRYGDSQLVDVFWNRVRARLLLLPKHDPQFRRNRERVNRDAERELIVCDWDLGDDELVHVNVPDVGDDAAEVVAGDVGDVAVGDVGDAAVGDVGDVGDVAAGDEVVGDVGDEVVGDVGDEVVAE